MHEIQWSHLREMLDLKSLGNVVIEAAQIAWNQALNDHSGSSQG